MRHPPFFALLLPSLVVLVTGCGGSDSLLQESLAQLGLEGGELPPELSSPEDVEGDATDEPDDDACEEAEGECRFTTYNLDVRTGDTFVLSHFVSCGHAPGSGYTFAYEEGAPWNLDAFNADEPVTITDDDLDGGDDGRYRLLLVDADGEELDHMTIRIDHDDESDVDRSMRWPRRTAGKPARPRTRARAQTRTRARTYRRSPRRADARSSRQRASLLSRPSPRRRGDQPSSQGGCRRRQSRRRW